MLLTGCRRGEALTATWDQFDLEAGVWTKPSAHTKQRKLHRVPLSGAAVALLQGMRHEAASPFVFPGAPGKPLSCVKRTWEAVGAVAGLEGVRLHDLRHTYASVLVSAGLSLPVIGALLGHTQTQTTARYSHLMDDPLRLATEKAASILANGGQSRTAQDRRQPIGDKYATYRFFTCKQDADPAALASAGTEKTQISLAEHSRDTRQAGTPQGQDEAVLWRRCVVFSKDTDGPEPSGGFLGLWSSGPLCSCLSVASAMLSK